MIYQTACSPNLHLSSSIYIVSVTWNGTEVSGPVLIYHDEVSIVPMTAQGLFSVFNFLGCCILVCRGHATSQGVAWHNAHGDRVTTSPLLVPFKFYQNITETGRVSRLARAHNTSLSPFSGLWTCRNHNTAIPVGLYQRGGGGTCS